MPQTLPEPNPLPSALRMLSSMLPPYCRDEVCGDIAELYTHARRNGEQSATLHMHAEILKVLLHLGALWLREHAIRHGPLHWQAIRLVRVAAKRSGVWYVATDALRGLGQPVQTLRLIVYDPARDAFLATRTREVAAGLIPPQGAFALGCRAAADRQTVEAWAAEIIAAMIDTTSAQLPQQRYQCLSAPYQRGRGAFQCRILALSLSGPNIELRPSVKGATLWAEPAAFLAAVSDDGLYARKAAAYRARMRHASA